MIGLLKSKLFWLILAAVLIFAGAWYFSSFKSAGLIWSISAGGKFFLPLIAIAALVDSINPCAFSILLLTIAFLFSLGRLRRDILKIGGFYILGIFLAYLAIGLGILQALHIFNIPHFMAKVGAGLLVAFGLINIFETVIPGFPKILKTPAAVKKPMARLIDRASLPTVFGLGVLVGLCEFPCTGGPYLMVLGMLHDQATFWSGFGYLLIYNFIFVLPLIIFLRIASQQNVLDKVQAWQAKERKTERLIAGLLMTGLGILIFFL